MGTTSNKKASVRCTRCNRFITPKPQDSICLPSFAFLFIHPSGPPSLLSGPRGDDNVSDGVVARSTGGMRPTTMGLVGSHSYRTPPTRGLTPPTRGLTPPTRGLTPPTRGLTPPTRGLSRGEAISRICYAAQTKSHGSEAFNATQASSNRCCIVEAHRNIAAKCLLRLMHHDTGTAGNLDHQLYPSNAPDFNEHLRQRPMPSVRAN